ncbi:MAG: agmatinase [Clostridia bacterium]
MNKNIQTFIGCDREYKDASIVLFGAPFDGTVSYRPGARFGSSAVRSESYGIETYSPYQDKDLCDIEVYDGGDLELPFGNTEHALSVIENYCRRLIKDKKVPVMVGGEHLVTLGTVRALVDEYPDLHVIHMDAHTDLRDHYLGEKLSHACVMKRLWEILGDKRIFQFGIRSGEKHEFEFAEKHLFIRKFDFSGLEELLPRLSGKPVYLSLDLDVLDPSVLGGTGTPEAGGVTFKELLGALLKMKDLVMVGADVCELAPHYDPSGVSTAVACKLLREILLLIGG